MIFCHGFAQKLWRGSIGLDWQVDFELRALPGFTGDADAAAVLLDDLLHDCKTETGAAFFS